MKVGFQGDCGAYSEVALYKYFQNKVTAIGYNLSEQVCESLENGDLDYAILPVENSIVGNVNVNMDLLYKSDFFVIGESYLQIEHCIMARAGVSLKSVKEVHSHPVALAQCRNFLIKNKLKSISSHDTAGSAHLLFEPGGESNAIIASKLCQKYHSLEILDSNIQNNLLNFTRFFIIIKKSSLINFIKKNKTSMAFKTKDKPGALQACLQIFSDNKINLTKIESRPIPENPFEYVFFVDFLGSLDEPRVKKCLENIGYETTEIKVLGSYNSASKSF